MITPEGCTLKYGFNPGSDKPNLFESQWMTMVVIPLSIHEQIPCLPSKVYCNKDFSKPFLDALNNICSRGLAHEFVEWGGCFNIRLQRGSDKWSIHSWAVACDVNPSTNLMGTQGNMSTEFVKCWTDAGFDWGGNFHDGRVDPMHYQLDKI